MPEKYSLKTIGEVLHIKLPENGLIELKYFDHDNAKMRPVDESNMHNLPKTNKKRGKIKKRSDEIISISAIKRDIINILRRNRKFSDYQRRGFLFKNFSPDDEDELQRRRSDIDCNNIVEDLNIIIDYANETKQMATVIDEAVRILSEKENPDAIRNELKMLKEAKNKVTTHLIAKYDVFLCYNSKDRREVKKIAGALRRKNITIWMDERITPGTKWWNEIKDIIKEIKTIAVFIGKWGMGPIQIKEIKMLKKEDEERGINIIPVYLPECIEESFEFSTFLKDFHFVDFRKSEPDPFEQLCYGIKNSY